MVPGGPNQKAWDCQSRRCCWMRMAARFMILRAGRIAEQPSPSFCRYANRRRPMTPEVLIVENDPEDLEDAAALLDNIDQSDKDKYGIDRFQIVPAKWGTKAVELLEQAEQNDRLFDIVLLDLQLPDQEHGALE